MKPLIGISACLFGEPVRYDQGDVTASELVIALKEHFELLPVCPEIRIGLPVPREPIHLSSEGAVMNTAWTKDYSHQLSQVAAELRLKHKKLCAFVFKSGSPSCGAGSVKVKTAQLETVSQCGTGAFAQKLVEKDDILFAEDLCLIRTKDRQDFISKVVIHSQKF